MSEEQQTATQAMRDQWERDARFRMRVNAAVARAMQEFQQGRRSDEIRERDLHHVAALAAATVLKSAFDEDSEIAMLRVEVEHYKRLAERATALQPAPQFLPADLCGNSPRTWPR